MLKSALETKTLAKRVPYVIVVVPEAEAELNGLKAFVHRKVVDAIAQNLKYDASSPSKHRKRLEGLIPGFMFEPPLWELKVGDLRVFYDIDQQNRMVYVRAVRRKPPGLTTQEVAR